ncbi:MAG: GTPase Era [Deltaproteobacteria bacterium]|jgi:GTP-binding protein Era|nr:GTPase Era [Deltaproteobacteria bacterium]
MVDPDISYVAPEKSDEAQQPGGQAQADRSPKSGGQTRSDRAQEASGQAQEPGGQAQADRSPKSGGQTRSDRAQEASGQAQDGSDPETGGKAQDSGGKAQEKGNGDAGPALTKSGKPKKPRKPRPPKPEPVHRAGFAVIFGAPNAGKSTLLNRILGEKVAAVAAKPQTTRHKILGVLTRPMAQLVFYDTPGYHESEKLLNQGIVSRAVHALADADVVLFLVDGMRRGEEHEAAMELVKAKERSKLVCAVSKSDMLSEKRMRPLTSEISYAFPGAPVIPVSAKNGNNVGRLIGLLSDRLPPSPALYPDDTLTDQSMRQIAAEFVRESVIRHTREEIPYATAVTVDRYEEPVKTGLRKTYIAATIHVEKDNQKVIVIGAGGRKLQAIGTAARENIERLVGGPVFLELFVRTTRDWSKRKASLQDFGYRDPS